MYSLGEIALVVIGILIALQINNWNEWRKDRVKEHKVLEELLSSLESNVRAIGNHLERLENYSKSSKIILSFIENKDDWERCSCSTQ